MRRAILNLAFVLMGVGLALSSCTSSDDTIDNIPDDKPNNNESLVFSFPDHITHSMGADELKSLTIEPNAKWEISLSKSAASHFYIADGDQKRQDMRGEAGKFQIDIKTTSSLDFDNDISCEVTMTQKNDSKSESKVIATLTKKKAQREVTIYSAKIEDGKFVEEQDGETTKTVYSSTAVGADGITMLVSDSDIDDIEARFKVESNCAWTMVLPEWLEANKLSGDVSSAEEIVIKVNTELLPEDVYSGEIEFISTQDESSVKIVKISIDAEAIAKNVEVYPAKVADGEYVVNGEDENGPIYEFLADQISSDAHAMRVNAANITEVDALFKVVTNFKWNIEAPEWIKPIEDQPVGESVVRLDVDYSKLPIEGDVEGELQIIDVAKSKAISTIKLSISAEQLTPKVLIYPALVEDGVYMLPEGESDFAVLYDSNVVPADGVQMIWPDDNTWPSVKLKVESNLPLTLSKEDWLTSGAELLPGVTELQIRADNTKLPKNALTSEVKFIDGGKSEERVLSSVKILYPGIDSFYSVTGFEKEHLFDIEGVTKRDENLVNFLRGTVRSTKNGAKVWLVALAMNEGKYAVDDNPDWATATLAAWDGDDLVQSRNLDVTVAANEGIEREAYLFVMPSSVEVDSAEDLFEIKSGIPTGKIVADYEKYLVTTIKQEGKEIEIEDTETEYFSVVNLEESASISIINTHWLTFELPSGVKPKEIYKLEYTKNSDNENSLFSISESATSSTYYCGNNKGNWVATDSADSWLTTESSDDGTRIKMNANHANASYSKQNEIYVGGILIKYADGTYVLVVCHYSADDEAEEEEEEQPLISYNWPDWAKQDQSTLVEVESGEWYDKYSSLGAPIFHLTYVKKFSTLSMLKGIDYNWSVEFVDGCDEWISYDPGEEYQTIFMNAFGKEDPKESDPIVNNNVTGVLIFRSEEGVELVLICTLAIPEE